VGLRSLFARVIVVGNFKKWYSLLVFVIFY
jgi:hypothetical protein